MGHVQRCTGISTWASPCFCLREELHRTVDCVEEKERVHETISLQAMMLETHGEMHFPETAAVAHIVYCFKYCSIIY